MVVDGVHYDALPNMKSAIYNFYKCLFLKTEPWRPKVDSLPSPLLRDSDKAFIEMSFNVEEVTKALPDCCGDKGHCQWRCDENVCRVFLFRKICGQPQCHFYWSYS